MCTMQQIKTTSNTIQEWKTIFPDFTTITGSSLFLKKLMAVTLSAITYFRDIFPENAYGERKFYGLKLKLLTEDCGIEPVTQFIDLIRSIYDAMDKKYLQQVNIGICTDPENRDNVLESYNIAFRYSDDEFSVTNDSSTVKFNEDNPTVQATLLLLKSIAEVAEVLRPLPKTAYLTIKILYNDDVTPPDYEPPGFEPNETEKFFYPAQAVKLELGRILTDFNSYRMYLKTALTKEPLSQMVQESMMNSSQQSKENVETQQSDEYVLSQNSQKETTSKAGLFEGISVSKPQQEKIECICNCNEHSDIRILECSTCERKQHSICYGILKPHELNSDFHCIQCINQVPFRSSQDDMIYTYEENKQQELAALRRALVYCTPLKQITALQLEKGLKCSKQLAKDLIEILELEGFVRRSGQKYIVNEKKLKLGLQMYFSKENKENFENSKNTKHSKAFFSKGQDLKNEKINIKRKANAKENDEILSEDQFMGLRIADEGEQISSKGSYEKQTKRTSKKRSFKSMTAFEDSEEVLPRSKRRCQSSKKPITLKD